MNDAAPTNSDDVITRLRAVNPAELDPHHADSPVARATLERILADSAPMDAFPRPRLRGRLPTRSVRGLGVVGASLVIGAAGALAATDPLGWWSPSRDQASYTPNPSAHVATPTAVKIRCQTGAGGIAACTPTSTLRQGLTYVRIGSISRPQNVIFTRRSLLASVSSARVKPRIPAPDAARLRADIAAVPDSFFTMMTRAYRNRGFGIESRTAAGKTLAPPAGTPAFLLCEDAPAGGLSCQALNRDTNAPLGAGVYAVNHTRRAWHTVNITQPRSETRLLHDMQPFGTIFRGVASRRQGTPNP